MFRLPIGCLLAFSLFAFAGPDSSRSFPEDNCAFSLPGQDWEWLDPAKSPKSNYKPLAYARNRAGVSFCLRIRLMAEGEAVGPDSYENLERSLTSKSRTWTRVDSKHITFKGVPAFQIDFRLNESKAAGRFVLLFADNRAYMLAVQSPAAELGPEADVIIDRFSFLTQPQPMMQAHEEKPNPVADRVDTPKRGIDGSSAAGIGGGAVLLILILFGAWMLIRPRG